MFIYVNKQQHFDIGNGNNLMPSFYFSIENDDVDDEDDDVDID